MWASSSRSSIRSTRSCSNRIRRSGFSLILRARSCRRTGNRGDRGWGIGMESLGVSLVTAAQPAGARFLALGDSYTIGEGVAEAERWPMQLAAALRIERIAIDDPEI